MQARPDSKYALRELYQEIDFFDRKIAYCEAHEHFDSEHARASALNKLLSKRATMVKSALAMASRGIACEDKYLPRSLKEAAASAPATS